MTIFQWCDEIIEQVGLWISRILPERFTSYLLELINCISYPGHFMHGIKLLKVLPNSSYLGKLYNHYLALSVKAKVINLSLIASSLSCWTFIMTHTSSNSLMNM